MATLVTAPALVETCDIFLAGGISGCPDWQTRAYELMDHTGLTIVNPRRPEGLETIGREAKRQIAWERLALDKARVTLFWFPAGESPCPIALFELGMALGRGKPVAIGAENGYPRLFDVVTQVKLHDRDLVVHPTLLATTTQAVHLARQV